jgi:hypothetical protein
MFEHYKPLRNFLRGHDLWSGLATTYCYARYLQFGKALPEVLLTPKLRMGASNISAGLWGHLVEMLARELLINAEVRGGKRFNTAAIAFKAMSMIHTLDGKSWASHSSRSNDILLQLSRIAFKQFPWLGKLTNGELTRYHMIYGHPRVAPMIEAEFGLSSTELFQIVMLLMAEMLERPTPALEFLRPAEPSVREPVWALIGRLSKSAAEMRAEMVESQCFDVNWAFSFNPLRASPLVHAGNPRSLMCPIPTFLYQRLTDGLYFDLIRADRHFGDASGKAFEDYVGAVASAIGDGRFELRPEACWGKPERRSVDWIILDKTAALFVECKLGRLDIASQIEIANTPPFLAAIERLAGHVGQLYATLTDALGGAYPHWQADGRPIHPIIVTFHEWFAFGPFFYKHLRECVAQVFQKRGLDAALLDRYPYAICSITEFEGLLSACRGASIDAVLSSKNDPEHRQWLMRGFLAKRYSGSLHASMGTFENGMDAVISRPSRLTRQT